MKKSLVFLIGLLIIFGAATAGAGILIHETEEITVLFTNDTNNQTSVMVKNQIGVGMVSAAVKKFNAVIIDEVPAGAGEILLDNKGRMRLKDLHGRDLNVPYHWLDEKGIRTVTFNLRNIPTVTSGAGDCCNCDASCEGACGVEFFYLFKGDNLRRGQWAEIAIKLEPGRLKPGKLNRVKLKIQIKNKAFRKGVVEIFTPNEVNGFQISLPEFPKDFETDIKGNGFLCKKEISPGEYLFNIKWEIKPGKSKVLRIQDLVKLSGSIDGRVFPKAKCKDAVVSQYTSETTVNLCGDLEMKR
ncbi:MAG: hypothetical protein ACM3WV_06020 [Bacillota bacterium]